MIFMCNNPLSSMDSLRYDVLSLFACFARGFCASSYPIFFHFYFFLFVWRARKCRWWQFYSNMVAIFLGFFNKTKDSNPKKGLIISPKPSINRSKNPIEEKRIPAPLRGILHFASGSPPQIYSAAFMLFGHPTVASCRRLLAFAVTAHRTKSIHRAVVVIKFIFIRH